MKNKNAGTPGAQKARAFYNKPVYFHFLAVFLIFLGIAAGYGHSLNYSFQYDDYYQIVHNELIHIKAVSWENVHPILRASRPVAYLSYALNFYLNGLETTGYHLMNLAIHLMSSLVVYMIFLKTLQLLKKGGQNVKTNGKRGEIALLGALLWAVHPVQTQAITYIVQRMAALAAFFYILSLLFYILGRQSRGKIAFLYFGLSIIAALLSFGTKENTLLLPLVILLYEFYFISGFQIRFSLKQALRLSGLFVILGLGLLWVIWRYQETFVGHSLLSAEYGAGKMDPLLRIMTEWRVIILYLTLLLFPYPGRLNMDYDFPFSVSLFNPLSTFLSLLAILVIITFAVLKAKRYPLISFAILWFLINLAIESTFLKLDLVFEHRLYLPSVMFFLPLSVMIFAVPLHRRVTLSVGMALVSLLVWMTYERNYVWKNEISLWSDVVSKSPNKVRGYVNLGDVYLKTGNIEKAIPTFQSALRLNPDIPMARNNLGFAYQMLGNVPLAIQEFKEAIRLAPDFPEPHFNLGNVYLRLNQDDLAAEEFKTLVRLNSYYNSKAHTFLGVLYHRKGDLIGAQTEFDLAVTQSPKSTFCQFNYAYFLEATGRKSEAARRYREALKWADMQSDINPDVIQQKLSALN